MCPGEGEQEEKEGWGGQQGKPKPDLQRALWVEFIHKIPATGMAWHHQDGHVGTKRGPS